MVPLSPDWISQFAELLMLVSMRVLGFFLVMPLFAFRANPMRVRVLLSLVIALGLMPLVSVQRIPVAAFAPGYLLAFIELAIGMAGGMIIRLGFMAVDVLAEVLSMQSGLSFAVSYARDPALSSGLMAEFLGLLAMALAFVLNIHLLVLDILLASFKVLPFGVWPTAWNLDALIGLVQDSFVLGLVLSLPAIAVYWLFNMTQSMLARVSPQMNLFSIGFSVMIPIAFVVIAFMLPQFSEIVQRALEVDHGDADLRVDARSHHRRGGVVHRWPGRREDYLGERVVTILPGRRDRLLERAQAVAARGARGDPRRRRRGQRKTLAHAQPRSFRRI